MQAAEVVVVWPKIDKGFQCAIQSAPADWRGYNNLAWLLAVCPERPLRDGEKAMRLAKKACELANWKSSYCLTTLAAAYAEAGDFEEAVKFQRKSIELGLPKDGLELAHELLDLYKNKKPYREGGATHGFRSSLGMEREGGFKGGSVVRETLDADVGEQEFPMVVAPKGFQTEQSFIALGAPELSTPLHAALHLATGGFDGA